MSLEQNRGAAVSVEPEVEQVFHWFTALPSAVLASCFYIASLLRLEQKFPPHGLDAG